MADLSPGFADPPVEAAVAFRTIMSSMAHPGSILDAYGPDPDGLSPAAALVLLTLADHTTPVYLSGAASAARHWLAFHTGAPEAGPEAATFAAGSWSDLLPLEAYSVGETDYPDRSTTLIVEMPHLSNDGPRLTGPGIETEARLTLPDTAALARNARLYPLGVDLFLTAGHRLAALPRSTRIEEGA